MHTAPAAAVNPPNTWPQRAPCPGRLSVAVLLSIVVMAASSHVRAAEQIVLQCPPGTQPAVKARNGEAFDQVPGTLMPSNRAVVCLDSGGQPAGPVLWIRPGLPISDRALLSLQRSTMTARQVVWSGEQRGERRVGKWTQFAGDGRIVGALALGAGDGAWRTFDDDGVVRVEGSLQRGLREGTWRWRASDGSERIAADFRAGVQEGDVVVYGDDSRQRLVEGWHDNKRHGLSTRWSPRGIKISEGSHDAGMRDGAWCTWQDEGVLLGCNHLKRGTGMWRQWSESGNIVETGQLLDDGRDGEWTQFYENGAQKAQGRYEKGRRVAGAWTYWDRDGHAVAHLRATINNADSRIFGVLRGGSVGGSVQIGGLGMRGSGVSAGGVGTARTQYGAKAPRHRTTSPAHPSNIWLTVSHDGGSTAGAPQLADPQQQLLIARLKTCKVPAGTPIVLRSGRGATAGITTALVTQTFALFVADDGSVRAVTPAGGHGVGAFGTCSAIALRTTQFGARPAGTHAVVRMVIVAELAGAVVP